MKNQIKGRPKKVTLDHDSKFEFWPTRDVLSSQRFGLKEKRRRLGVPKISRKSEPIEPPKARVNARVAEPPPAMYEVESVYRFTRANNDLTNPGMGYGEITEEAAWELHEGKMRLRSFFVRRTRSSRKRLETDDAEYVSPAGVVSQYPPPRGEKAK